MRKLHSFGMTTLKKKVKLRNLIGETIHLFTSSITQTKWKLGEVSTYQTLFHGKSARVIDGVNSRAIEPLSVFQEFQGRDNFSKAHFSVVKY